jgi:hypothetical protein
MKIPSVRGICGDGLRDDHETTWILLACRCVRSSTGAERLRAPRRMEPCRAMRRGHGQTLVVLIMGVALGLMPVAAFPFLRRYDETLALGYAVFRGALQASLRTYSPRDRHSAYSGEKGRRSGNRKPPSSSRLRVGYRMPWWLFSVKTNLLLGV